MIDKKRWMIAAACLLAAGVASAGSRLDGQVSITYEGKYTWARGGLVSARESADTVQAIGCQLEAFNTDAEPNGSCFAVDRAYRVATCATNRNPTHNRIIASIGAASFIEFSSLAGVCNYLRIESSSASGPTR